MKIAVCDENAEVLDQHVLLVKRWCSAHDMPDAAVERFSDGEALVKAHALGSFDIVLLEPAAPTPGGMEAARGIRAADKETRVVFLASSAEHAVESYSVKASNYLLKPVNPDALNRCLDELVKEIELTTRKIAIKSPRANHNVSLGAIAFVEAHRKNAEVVMANGDRIISAESIGKLGSRLLSESGFFKCHRSHIVNIRHVAKYQTDALTMREGTRIPIARRCRSEFKQAYFETCFEGID